jgi:hypothetical protein
MALWQEAIEENKFKPHMKENKTERVKKSYKNLAMHLTAF